MPSRRPPERVSLYRRLPLWFQWGFPFVIAIAVVVAIVVFVSDHQGQDGSEAPISTTQLKVENKEANATLRQEQEPHTVKLGSGLTPAHAMEHAISSWIDGQYKKTGAWGGDAEHAACHTVAGDTSASRVALKCTVKVSGERNEFLGVVEPKRGRMTYCEKILYPPQYGEKAIPVSRACS